MNLSRQRFLLNSRLLGCLLVALILGGCVTTGTDGPRRKAFSMESVIKTDIDTVLEFHVEGMRELLQQLMVKLYKRNPRELAKSPYGGTIEANVEILFNRITDFGFPGLYGRTGTEAMNLAVNEDYDGDRVFALVAGLTAMVMASYEYQVEFYLFDTVDPQKLYNSARNIEIAVWKIKNDRRANGELYLLTNSLSHEARNFSYERLFGKLIATQDNIAVIMADKQNRVLKKVLQNMATAVFLPI